jgi:hypothetical protein
MIDLTNRVFHYRRVSVLKRARWIAVTAGVGSLEFEGAAKRVKADLEESGVVDKVIAVLTRDLPEICPVTSKIYSELMNPDTRGFGFMSWKAEIVKAAFDGMWGEFDGVIWIDAGCEVSINPFSRLKFRYFQKYARTHGVACFALSTKEFQYTKRDMFDLFPEIDPYSAGDQIQTTWMMLYAECGRDISDDWFDLVCQGTHLLDLEPSKNDELQGFIENRYDQSAFSLVCKNKSIRVMQHRPTAGSGSYISTLRGLVNPIWTSRNRGPASIKRKIHNLFENRK